MIFIRHFFIFRQDNHLFHLHKLMDPIQTRSIFSIRTSLSTITCRISAIFFWQLFFIQDFIHMICCYWYFRGSDQPLIISFHPICIFFSTRKISCSYQTFRIDNIRYIHRCKSFFYKSFQCILKYCLFQ